MRHIFIIDPLENLNTKKDSSLLLALKAQNLGEAYVCFKNQVSFKSLEAKTHLVCHSFSGQLKSDSFYLESFKLEQEVVLEISDSDCLHLRIDPPVDESYFAISWLLDSIGTRTGARVVNNPQSVLALNEKLYAFIQEGAPASYVGEDLAQATAFMQDQQGENFILKPLNSFSGIGVEKHSRSEFTSGFEAFRQKFKGPVIVQPFFESVHAGEYRTVTWQGEIIGTILKTPPKGSFLANIAQGASAEPAELSPPVSTRVRTIAEELQGRGVPLVAFDILGEVITEINITCPGLLVEVSETLGEDLCHKILSKLKF